MTLVCGKAASCTIARRRGLSRPDRMCTHVRHPPPPSLSASSLHSSLHPSIPSSLPLPYLFPALSTPSSFTCQARRCTGKQCRAALAPQSSSCTAAPHIQGRRGSRGVGCRNIILAGAGPERPSPAACALEEADMKPRGPGRRLSWGQGCSQHGAPNSRSKSQTLRPRMAWREASSRGAAVPGLAGRSWARSPLGVRSKAVRPPQGRNCVYIRNSGVIELSQSRPSSGSGQFAARRGRDNCVDVGGAAARTRPNRAPRRYHLSTSQGPGIKCPQKAG
jgi:hypothetical protein